MTVAPYVGEPVAAARSPKPRPGGSTPPTSANVTVRPFGPAWSGRLIVDQEIAGSSPAGVARCYRPTGWAGRARGEGEILHAGVGPDCVGYRTNLTRIHRGTGADADNMPGAALRDGPEWLGYRIYGSPVRSRPHSQGCVAQWESNRLPTMAPCPSSPKGQEYLGVAQRAVRAAVNRQVAGSIPASRASYCLQGVAQPSRAPALEAGGRWCEPNRPDQFEGTRAGYGKPSGAVQSGPERFGYLGRGRKTTGSNPARTAHHARSNVTPDGPAGRG